MMKLVNIYDSDSYGYLILVGSSPIIRTYLKSNQLVLKRRTGCYFKSNQLDVFTFVKTNI